MHVFVLCTEVKCKFRKQSLFSCAFFCFYSSKDPLRKKKFLFGTENGVCSSGALILLWSHCGADMKLFWVVSPFRTMSQSQLRMVEFSFFFFFSFRFWPEPLHAFSGVNPLFLQSCLQETWFSIFFSFSFPLSFITYMQSFNKIVLEFPFFLRQSHSVVLAWNSLSTSVSINSWRCAHSCFFCAAAKGVHHHACPWSFVFWDNS